MENQQEQATSKTNNFWNWLRNTMIMYANLYVNGAIILAISILINVVIFRLWLKLSLTWIFILSFLIFVGLSPLFSKMTFGKNLAIWYFDFLERKFGVKV